MIKRLLFVIVYAICFPLIFPAVFSIIITLPIAGIIYIVKGDKEDVLMDFVTFPIQWVVDLPYKIMKMP